MKSSDSDQTEVVVTDIQMPFWSMVTFMVKWSLAPIPAFIILFVLIASLTALLTATVGGLPR